MDTSLASKANKDNGPGVCVRRAPEYSGKVELAFMLFSDRFPAFWLRSSVLFSECVGRVEPKA